MRICIYIPTMKNVKTEIRKFDSEKELKAAGFMTSRDYAKVAENNLTGGAGITRGRAKQLFASCAFSERVQVGEQFYRVIPTARKDEIVRKKRGYPVGLKWDKKRRAAHAVGGRKASAKA